MDPHPHNGNQSVSLQIIFIVIGEVLFILPKHNYNLFGQGNEVNQCQLNKRIT